MVYGSTKKHQPLYQDTTSPSWLLTMTPMFCIWSHDWYINMRIGYAYIRYIFKFASCHDASEHHIISGATCRARRGKLPWWIWMGWWWKNLKVFTRLNHFELFAYRHGEMIHDFSVISLISLLQIPMEQWWKKQPRRLVLIQIAMRFLNSLNVGACVLRGLFGKLNLSFRFHVLTSQVQEEIWSGVYKKPHDSV